MDNDTVFNNMGGMMAIIMSKRFKPEIKLPGRKGRPKCCPQKPLKSAAWPPYRQRGVWNGLFVGSRSRWKCRIGAATGKMGQKKRGYTAPWELSYSFRYFLKRYSIVTFESSL
jgi:hypothetical protein